MDRSKLIQNILHEGLNLTKKPYVSILNHDNKEIKVYEHLIRKELSIVGETIDAIQLVSDTEMVVRYYDNAWGGVTGEEWGKLYKKLASMVDVNSGLEDYVIIIRENTVRLSFEYKDYVVGTYE